MEELTTIDALLEQIVANLVAINEELGGE